MFMLSLVPARIETTPIQFVTAYKTWDTTLKCDIFGYPAPKVNWGRPPDKELPINSRKRGNELTIINIKEEDGGAYFCEGDNQLDESKKAAIWIFVHEVGKIRI